MRTAWKLFPDSFNVQPRGLFCSLTYIGCSKEKLLSDLPGTSAHLCHTCTGAVTWILLHLLLFLLQSLRGRAADQPGASGAKALPEPPHLLPSCAPFEKPDPTLCYRTPPRQAELPTHLFFTLLMSLRRSLTEVSGSCLLPGRSKRNHHCFQHSGCVPSEGC